MAQRLPASLIPSINPFTGKEFSSEEEKQTFIQESHAKRLKRLEAAKERQALKESAVQKIIEFFVANGFSEDEIRLVFGRTFHF